APGCQRENSCTRWRNKNENNFSRRTKTLCGRCKKIQRRNCGYYKAGKRNSCYSKRNCSSGINDVIIILHGEGCLYRQLFYYRWFGCNSAVSLLSKRLPRVPGVTGFSKLLY